MYKVKIKDLEDVTKLLDKIGKSPITEGTYRVKAEKLSKRIKIIIHK